MIPRTSIRLKKLQHIEVPLSGRSFGDRAGSFDSEQTHANACAVLQYKPEYGARFHHNRHCGACALARERSVDNPTNDTRIISVVYDMACHMRCSVIGEDVTENGHDSGRSGEKQETRVHVVDGVDRCKPEPNIRG
jgi:hypothetical protein